MVANGLSKPISASVLFPSAMPTDKIVGNSFRYPSRGHYSGSRKTALED